MSRDRSLTPFDLSKRLSAVFLVSLILLSPGWANSSSTHCPSHYASLADDPGSFDRNLRQIKTNLANDPIYQPQVDELVKGTLDLIHSKEAFFRLFDTVDPPVSSTYDRVYKSLAKFDLISVLKRIEAEFGASDWERLENCSPKIPESAVGTKLPKRFKTI